MRFMFRLLAAVAAVALSVGAANAAPIVSVSVSYPTSVFTPANTPAGTSTLNLPALTGAFATTGIGTNPPVPPGTFTGITGLTITLGNFTITTAPSTTGTGSVATTFTLSTALGTADFQLTSPFTISSDNTPVGATKFTTSVVQVGSNTTGLDFSQFTAMGGGGMLTFAGTGFSIPAGSPGTFQFQGGGTAQGGFTMTSNAALATPEPASLAVFGVLALGGLAVARRKFLAKRDTV